MFSAILNISRRTTESIIKLPRIAQYSYLKSISDYSRQIGGKKPSIFTRALLLIQGIANVPKYTLRHILGADRNLLYSAAFDLTYNIVIMSNPIVEAFTVLKYLRKAMNISSIVSRLTPAAIASAFGDIFRTISRCIFGPFRWFFNQIIKLVQMSFNAIFKVQKEAQQRQRLILEQNIMDQSVISRIWEGFKKVVSAIVGPVLKFGFKLFDWVWKHLEPIIYKVYVPIASCASNILRSAGLSSLLGVLSAYSQAFSLISTDPSSLTGKSIQLINSIRSKIGGSYIDEKGNVRAWGIVGMVNNFFASILGVTGMGFINVLFLKKYQTIMQYTQYAQLTQTFYSIYQLTESMNALANGDFNI